MSTSLLPVFLFVGVLVAGAIGQVADSAADAKPLQVGATTPNAPLHDLDGNLTSVRKVLGHKPTVLIFYRGGWCPFCNAHLADMVSIEGDVVKRGYQIVAISPDKPAELTKTLDRHHMTFKLYSDSSANAMKKFGVAFRVDDATFLKMRDGFGADIEKASGQTHHILPVPTLYLVDRSGKITYVHSDPNFKVRLKGSELLAAMDAAK